MSLDLVFGSRGGKSGRVRKGGETLRRIFYVDDSLLALTDPVRLQELFEILTGLLYRMGIWKTVRNVVGII